MRVDTTADPPRVIGRVQGVGKKAHGIVKVGLCNRVHSLFESHKFCKIHASAHTLNPAPSRPS